MTAAAWYRLHVIVPARDEARTIEAKLADLARSSWPAPVESGPHTVVIVDDHSSDTTAALAEGSVGASTLRAAGILVQVLCSGEAPGKPGAIRAGLAQVPCAGDGAQGALIVLTDADVQLAEGALLALVRAFEGDPRLGMASGTQRYVRDSTPSGDSSVLRSDTSTCDMGAYDRVFRGVRRIESRLGALLSVHGQLLAWRAELALAPPDGRAADDLELVVAARDRASRPRVRMIPGAEFFERRAPIGAAREAQALRRARAWFQHFGGPAPRRRALRWQWQLWRCAPTVALALGAPLAFVSPGLAARCAQWRAARDAERAAPMPARWEAQRS